MCIRDSGTAVLPVPWYATCYASRGPHCFPCRHNSHEPSRYLACICLRVVIVQCPFGGERAACPAGFWTNGQTDSSSCVSCPRGTFYPTDGDADSTCTPCPPGTFSDVSHHRSAAGTQSTLESSGTNSIGCRFATRPLQVPKKQCSLFSVTNVTANFGFATGVRPDRVHALPTRDIWARFGRRHV